MRSFAWVFVALAAIIFGATADARLMLHNGASVGGSPFSRLAVYPGCTQPAIAATRKTWHVSPDPTIGQTPAQQTTAGVPAVDQGNAAHPLYPLQAFTGQATSGGLQVYFPGWHNVLDGLHVYNHIPGNAVQADFFNLTDLETNDPNHLRIWPGDEVILDGIANVSFGDFSTQTFGGNMSTGVPGAPSSDTTVQAGWTVVASGVPAGTTVVSHGSPTSATIVISAAPTATSIGENAVFTSPGGAQTTTLLTQFISGNVNAKEVAPIKTAEVDDAGNIVHVYYHGNPAGPRPLIGSINVPTTSGFIFQGLDPTHSSVASYANVKSSIGFQWQTNQPTDGMTVTVAGDTWTFKTTVTDPNTQILIGATPVDTYANAAAALTANPGGLSGTAMATYSASSSIFNITSKTNGLPGILKVTSTFPVTFTPPTIWLSSFVTPSSSITSHGSPAAPSHDNIYDDLHISSGPQAPTSFVRDLYPQTGSLGIDPDTGQQTLTPGGPWNVADFLYQGSLGFIMAGSDITGTQNTADGQYCDAVTNTDVYYSYVGGSLADTHHSLVQNVRSNYAGGDAYDSYSSWNVTWDNITAYNIMENGKELHPDGIQPGQNGANVGPFDNLVINRFGEISDTDPNLNTVFWHDANSTLKDLSQRPSGILMTNAKYNQVTVTNSLIYQRSCTAISVSGELSTILEGNTAIWDGSPTFAGCSQASVVFHNATTQVGTASILNNVANSISTNQPNCPVLGTVADNIVTNSWVAGVQHNVNGNYCTNANTKFNGPFVSSMFNGGVIYIPDPTTLFTDYPTNNPTGNPDNLDLTPLVFGPLFGSGTACCGFDLSDSYPGTPRSNPPNIGAY